MTTIIATKIIIGSTYALPAACLCICIHLEQVASGRLTQSGYAVKKRRQWFEAAMCFGLPAVFMALREFSSFFFWPHNELHDRLYRPRTPVRSYPRIRLPPNYLRIHSCHSNRLDSAHLTILGRTYICRPLNTSFHASPTLLRSTSHLL